jgi:K+-sensing histidine kinase KdpD
VIEFEFAHLNGLLVQLLGLYKLGVNQMPLHPAYHELDDFIEAQLAGHQDVFRSRGIMATYEVDPLSPLGFFDRELIASVLDNMINNAIRHGRQALLISVSDEAGQLVLTINDDGEGYPAEMIERQAEYVQGINHQQWQHWAGLVFRRQDRRAAPARRLERAYRDCQRRCAGRWSVQALSALSQSSVGTEPYGFDVRCLLSRDA